ncbi:VIT family protein [Novosphingobium bradum]|uniref:VIT family protein n=1 Tax=Novosphingobium bradum TaxID=1737444 RepID=A0ABV7IN38_9SPHN
MIERHAVHRTGWLRAAVMGANDGIVSTASLIIGVAAAAGSEGQVLLAGLAALVAGAMSMAAGEYVSVSSQADTEAADLARERDELARHPEAELDELAAIYRGRGLSSDLAHEVAHALTMHDALATHARDELGMADFQRARPVQAACCSAICFGAGASLPLAIASALPLESMTRGVALSSLLFLMMLGALGARAGRASVGRAVARVAFWGVAAMGATWAIGSLFGTGIG